MWIALASLILAEAGYILTTGHILDALLSRAPNSNAVGAGGLMLSDLVSDLEVISGGSVSPATTLLGNMSNVEIIVSDLDSIGTVLSALNQSGKTVVYIIVISQPLGAQEVQWLNDLSLSIIFERSMNRTRLPIPVFLIPGQSALRELVDVLARNGATLQVDDRGRVALESPYVLVFRNGELVSVYPLSRV